MIRKTNEEIKQEIQELEKQKKDIQYILLCRKRVLINRSKNNTDYCKNTWKMINV